MIITYTYISLSQTRYNYRRLVLVIYFFLFFFLLVLSRIHIAILREEKIFYLLPRQEPTKTEIKNKKFDLDIANDIVHRDFRN